MSGFHWSLSQTWSLELEENLEVLPSGSGFPSSLVEKMQVWVWIPDSAPVPSLPHLHLHPDLQCSLSLSLSFNIFMGGVIDVRETVQISGTQFDEFGQMGTSLKPPPQQR